MNENVDSIDLAVSGESNVERDGLLYAIVDREQQMFINVRSQTPASCQQNIPAFRIHRLSQLCPWSEATLASYLTDLQRAQNQQQNLMQKKYALMEQGRSCAVPVGLDEIVALQIIWQQELLEKYPQLEGQGRELDRDDASNTSFKTYLLGELRTFSTATLSLLYKDMLACQARGENWNELILLATIRYQRLDEKGSDHDGQTSFDVN